MHEPYSTNAKVHHADKTASGISRNLISDKAQHAPLPFALSVGPKGPSRRVITDERFDPSPPRIPAIAAASCTSPNPRHQYGHRVDGVGSGMVHADRESEFRVASSGPHQWFAL